ncbi:MAG: biotin transporter BioY [Eubacteriales bacterium]|nr:biotin transporter BioY [Eubacteriales bacterium]
MKNSATTTMTTKNIASIGLMTAVLCLLGPISLPIGLVPITLGTLGIYLTAYLLGWKKGVLCTIIYLLLGMVGVPVFSNFGAGLAKLVGPTGGYLIGYIPMSFIIGFFADKFRNNKPMQLLGMILATIVLYAIGTAWLSVAAKLTFAKALAAGVTPFIVGDAIKIVMAMILGMPIKDRVALFNQQDKVSKENLEEENK